MNESTRIQHGFLWLLVILSLITASCGENGASADLDASEMPPDLSAADGGV